MFSAASKTDNVSSAANYIEDVFSTYLYTGVSNTALQIQNGIDLSTKGGMVWIKCRSNAVNHALFDTSRGVASSIQSNSANAASATPQLGAFNTNGFTHSATPTNQNLDINETSRTFVSWTFRKQPKFFDVVTYTGNGANRTIAHNLGSVPGCIIIKRTDGITNWNVYHRSLTNNTYYMLLNTTDAQTNAGGTTRWNSTTPTSTVFSLGTDGDVNASGGTYVAYLFAHDAGGFGASGTDNVISCGSVTLSSGFTDVNLGYEPQFVLIKKTSAAQNWFMYDNMRGMPWDGYAELRPNSSAAEGTSTTTTPVRLTATGMQVNTTYFGTGDYIYIAIRRGPMKTPTTGTSVLTVYTAASTAANQVIGTIPVDLSIVKQRTETNPDFVWDRLRGSTPYLITSSTNAEANANYAGFDQSNGYREKSGFSANPIYWLMARAPSFMDVVCYTGTGSATTVTHNLTVPPELIIVKRRNQAGWNGAVYAAGSPGTLLLDQTSGAYTTGYYAGCFTSTSATTFGVNTIGEVNGSGGTYVAWMWASCPGVSKVGSYNGTGGTQTISCGFAARFVMIKRTDSTGDWWVWDTARGMVAGTDPRLPLNTASSETNANWVYTDASGFQIVTTDATVNASGGTYIYLAIA